MLVVPTHENYSKSIEILKKELGKHKNTAFSFYGSSVNNKIKP
jgi:hypothetical protein